MFTYSHALVTCLKSLGLADVIYTANTSVQVHIDESLFMIPNITHMSFGSVSFYLFCCLDWHRAFMQLKPFWPSENPLEIKKYNRLALRWMQQLNQNKTWLNYVPLEPVYFTECAGPLMQKTMLALTLVIMEHLIQHDFKTHLPAAQHLNRENVQWTYETYSHVFQEIEHHPQDVRKKQFEASIIQHLKSSQLGQDYLHAIRHYLDKGCHHYHQTTPISTTPTTPSTPMPTTVKYTPSALDLQLEKKARDHVKRLPLRTLFNTAYYDQVTDTLQHSGFRFSSQSTELTVEKGRKAPESPPEKRDVRIALAKLYKPLEGFKSHPRSFQTESKEPTQSKPGFMKRMNSTDEIAKKPSPPK